MNERLKEIRVKLGLSQTEVAKKIGVSRSAISRLESGDINFTEQMVKSICRELHINEAWFRAGEGEMLEKKGETLDELLGGRELSSDERSLFESFLSLPADSRKLVIEFVEFSAAQFASNVSDSVQDLDSAARVAELERQLAAEKARADAAEADAKAKAEELLALYREDEAKGDQRGLSVEALEGRPSSR